MKKNHKLCLWIAEKVYANRKILLKKSSFKFKQDGTRKRNLCNKNLVDNVGDIGDDNDDDEQVCHGQMNKEEKVYESCSYKCFCIFIPCKKKL